MAEIDLTKLASRVEDAPEPIKRTTSRDGTPNPFEPMVSASWDARTKRGHKDAEVGSTKQVRAYTNDQATAIVRALRRASDALNLGVKIDAPTEDYTETAEDGTTKTKTRYVAGTIRFESVKRQERKRKPTETAASADAPEDGNGDESDEDNGDESGDDNGDESGDESTAPQSEEHREPAWS